MAPNLVVRPTGTSWGAVIDGWLAAVGVAALATPMVGLLLANAYTTASYASTVPILVAVGLAYLIGGYVAGRMAGSRTSWHGMLCAFFGLFVSLAVIVLGIAIQAGVFGTSGSLVEVLPAVLGITLYRTAETFAFGGALALLLAIFAGWLGGLLAPTVTRPEMAAAEQREVRREASRPRERFRLFPQAGRKGGERADESKERETTEGH